MSSGRCSILFVVNAGNAGKIGRSFVEAIIPEQGMIITEADAKQIKTKVEAILPEAGYTITDLQNKVARTKVEPMVLEDGTIITDVVVRIIRTKVEAAHGNITSPQPGL